MLFIEIKGQSTSIYLFINLLFIEIKGQSTSI